MIVLIAFVVLGLDQFTKTLVVEHLQRPVHLIGPLSLQLTYNSGVAFSLGTGFGLPIVLIVCVVLIVLFARRQRALSVPAAIGAGLIIGGALGNLTDRVFRGRGGSVVDFIHTTFWPTFNVADTAVVCGCVIAFFAYWNIGEARMQQRTDRQTNEVPDDGE